MSDWTYFWSFFQVFYLLLVTVGTVFATIYWFFDKISLNENQIYAKYVIEEPKNFGPNNPPPTKDELVFLVWLFRGMIICVLPSVFLIYRSRLLVLKAFQLIKMHKGGRTGVAYIKAISWMNYLFCLSRIRVLDYDKYILYKAKNKHSYERLGEYSAATIILLILFFRLWNTEMTEFILPWSYLILISLLLFQKFVIFILKAVLFLPVWAIVSLYQCIFVRKCRCSRRKPR